MAIGLIVDHVAPVLSVAHTPNAWRGRAKVAADVGVVLVAVVAAYALRFDGVPPAAFIIQAAVVSAALPSIRLIAGRRFGTHRASWRLFGLPEALNVVRAVGTVSAALVALRMVMPWIAPDIQVVPLGVIALEGLVGLSLGLALRVGARIVDERAAVQRLGFGSETVARRAVLVGAGRAGRMAARELRQRPDAGFRPVAFLDDDPSRQGQVIEGLQVVGTTADAPRLARQLGAMDVILTMPSASRAAVRRVVERCRSSGLAVQTVPGLCELIAGRVGITRILPVDVHDLLGREVVKLDDHAAGLVRGALWGKRVLVTGAGGSIGSELCRQLAKLNPEALILLERNENNLFDIEQEMRVILGERAIPCLADVRDEEQIDLAMLEHRPQVVFHAAAYKHVPMMERYPAAAIDNNVRGTRVVVEASHRHHVERFLLVSTDKAVNPTSLMGASKRVAELVLHQQGRRTTMRCCAVRFGNVLGSRGSVLHTFRRQIERGGPVTVTHADVTRFFMTIPEASRLLLQAVAIGTGGETFLLDMGESVRILDMARQMIRLAGLTEDEVPIEIVGLRPGEKMHEELLRSCENESPSGVEGIMLARGAASDQLGLRERVSRLEHAANRRDIAEIRALMTELTGYCQPDHGVGEELRRAATAV